MTCDLQNNSAQCNSFALPSYPHLFRMHTWAENTVLDWPCDVGEPPELIRELLRSLSELVEAACAKEGLTYGAMLAALHRGQFGVY
jgi:hypothetical protein